MHQKFVSVAIYWLVFWPNMVFSSAGTMTMAGHQNPSATIADPGVYSEPPMLDATHRISQSTPSHDASGWTAEFDINAGATTTLQNTRQAASIPCLHRIFSDDPIEDNPEVNECSKQPDEPQSFSIQFGRQIDARSGILGDVDGVRVDYRLTSGLILNGLAGYPVLSAEDKFNATRRVFGISADLAKFGQFWNLNSYVIEQHDNEGPASRAVGGAIRYVRPKRSLLFYTDYDVAQESLNALVAAGAWMLPYRTKISAALDIRNSPIQKRQQNYLQQSMVSAKGWRWILPADRIKQLTMGGAKGVSTLALGLSHAFSQRLTLSSDVAAIDASTDDETDSTALHEPFEYFSHLELTARNLIVSGDSNVLDLRYRVTDSSQISSACIRTRYDISRYWTINPRFTTDYRNKAHDNLVTRVSSSAVKMEYRWKSKSALQFELGGNWSYEETPNTDKRNSTYFLALGYQRQF